jgi:hypothetical protein
MNQTQISKDGLWVFRVINSCKLEKELNVAKNCYKQFEIKWLHKILPDDEKSIRLFKQFLGIIDTQISKVEKKLK